jgi:hypothetical protein
VNVKDLGLQESVYSPVVSIVKFPRVLTPGTNAAATTVGDRSVLESADAVTIDWFDVRLEEATPKGIEYECLLGPCSSMFKKVSDRLPSGSLMSAAALNGWTVECSDEVEGIIAIYNPKHKRSHLYQFSSSVSTPAATREFQGFVAGSASHSIQGWFDANAALVSATMFSVYDNATKTYTYDPDSLNAAVGGKLSCVAAWNSSTNGRAKAGTLITKKHAWYADHYRPGVGATVRFVKLDGTVVERTIVRQTQVTGITDCVIATLNEPINDIEPARLIYPEDFQSKLPTYWSKATGSQYEPDVSAANVPAFVLDQQRSRVRTLTWNGVNAIERLAQSTYLLAPTQTNPAGPAVAGDSGSPIFAVLGTGEPVLLSVTWSPNWSGGTAISPGSNDALKAVVEAEGESLTYADLYSYSTF